ncbi:YccF domain-containing protein [Porticoccus litoralis]|uniref:Inner membrane protein YccF n=1 Tax=Porticoccus litoralis TaxID=434086 RepID=A0AAW8B3Q9_9GAMM|nr:YccF domain-containing protein [Porticoccus litoralis]MDP1520377.1 YccF domain-containing protein [Porticoccus litoralis]
MLRFLGNLLWLIFGGLLMGLAWWLIGLVAFITIVGIPWGRSCFVIGQFTFLPFGREAVSRSVITGKEDLGTGALGLLGNIIWFILAGFWLAVGHITLALALFITIIGIPFALQHLKLALLTLAPVGKVVVKS